MIIRTKSGEYRADNSSMLLDFLGVKKEAAGVQSNLGTRFAVSGDVVLVAGVPFSVSSKQ